MLIELAVVNPCNRNLADPRNVNLPGTVHNHAQISVDLAPDADLQLVVRADHVIARNLYPVRGSKCAWRLNKKCLAEERKRASNRVRHDLLELGVRMQRQFNLLALAEDSPEQRSRAPEAPHARSSTAASGSVRGADSCGWRIDVPLLLFVLRATRGQCAAAAGSRQAVRL